jgi:hypothetical protein
MPKTKISEFDVDPSNNTDINSINIAEGCAPSGINNAIRQLMSDLKEQQTGASGDSFTVGGNLAVTGTSAFTGATTFTGAVVFSTNITLDTPTINSPVIVYEGATANDFETTLVSADPTADRTLTFPDKTGTIAVTSDLPSNTSLTSGSGTYSIAGTTMTISDTSHGLTTGFQIYCDFTSGTAVDNYFTVTVTDANTFTIPYGSSLTTSGNVTWYYSPKGLVSIASSAEALVGTNTDRAVTPAGLAGSFTKSLATNGWQKLQSGLIMQWGTSSSLGQDSSVTVTYPIAFTTAVYNVQITGNQTLSTGGLGIQTVSSVGTTSFVINNGQDTTMTFYWFAIGY